MNQTVACETNKKVDESRNRILMFARCLGLLVEKRQVPFKSNRVSSLTRSKQLHAIPRE